MSIKRYKIISEDWGYEENPRGMFVMVSDHIAAHEAVKATEVADDDRMIQIEALIKELQGVRDRFGNTCVYIRRGGMGWGAVALNRKSDDEKNGVFDLQKQHDRDMFARLEQIERLKADRDRFAAIVTSPALEAKTEGE